MKLSKIKFNHIKNLFAFWFTLVAAIPLIIFSIVIYTQRYKSLENIESEKLVAIRNLKVKILNQWFNELEGHFNIISSDNNIKNFSLNFTKNDIKNIRKFLIKYKKNYSSFLELFLLDSKKGKIIISTNKKNEGKIYSEHLFFKNPLQSGNIYISDINYYTTRLRPQMFFHSNSLIRIYQKI